MSARAPFDPEAPAPRGHALLEASAGTGKTHTITSLVLRYVAERGIPLGRVLVVTFTRAAAAELRDRIRRRLTDAAKALEEAVRGDAGPPDDVVVRSLVEQADSAAELAARARRLRAATSDLDDATVATIHGFCQRVLSASALDADVDLDAELLDDETSLRLTALDDELARALTGAGDDWYGYLREARAARLEQLETLAAQAVAPAEPRILPEVDPDGWPAVPLTTFDAEAEAFGEVWRRHRAALGDELGALKGEKVIKGWQRRRDPATGELRSPVELAAEEVDAWLAEASVARLRTAQRWRASGSTTVGLRFFAERATPAHPVLAGAGGVLAACGDPAGRWRAGLAHAVRRRYERRKREQRVVTYDDQLRRLAEALEEGARADALGAAIRQRYAVALIDESQDTDPVQWRIFSRVFADAPLVLIGDPKQAIYGFRGANLRTYLNAAATMPAGARLTLGESWRSEQRYLDAVNALFARDRAFGDEGVTAPPLRAAEARRERTLTGARGAPLRVRYVTASAAEADGGLDRQGAITKGWARRILPVDVAAQVVDLLTSGRGVRRDGGERELAAGDLAVLTRSNHEADLVHAALTAAGVPATRARSGSVLASPEALALLRLLEAMAQPGREPLARAAALTPPFGWTAGALLDPAHEPAWEDWRAALAAWRTTWEADGVRAALSRAFAEQGAWPWLLAGERGDRAVTNLGHLTERLHAAEAAERLGPGALLAWLRRARAEALEGTGPASEDAELRLERDDAAVQVATVHGAKGLEFGIVLCPFLWHASGIRDEQILRFHDPDDDDERLTLDLHLDTKAEPKRSNLERAAREAAQEDLRLAYVALTRAVHEAVVWWGPFSGASDSPLATLLAPSGGEPPADGDGDPARAAVEALADGSEAIAVEVLEAPPSPRRYDAGARRAPGATLQAATFDRTLDRAWQRTSFTALTRAPRRLVVEGDEARELGRDVDDDPAAVDRGAAPADGGPAQAPPDLAPDSSRADGTLADAPPSAAPPVLLAEVPRGPVVGDLLHRILEHTDFTAAPDAEEALPAVGARSLRAQPELAAWRGTIVDGLTAALATPLGADLGDARLADLGRADRLDELAFELPLAGGHAPRAPLTLDDLAGVLRRHDDGLEAAAALEALPPAVRHRPTRGFLTGSVDLVARLWGDGGGRYLVVDYKTTWLGERGEGGGADRSTAWHYRGEALEEAMRPHGYHLQALLYLVAVHRHLRARLGPAYDPDADLAGVAYLFLRGMTGPAARRPDGRTDGVWRWRPSAALVEDASRLLARGGDR